MPSVQVPPTRKVGSHSLSPEMRGLGIGIAEGLMAAQRTGPFPPVPSETPALWGCPAPKFKPCFIVALPRGCAVLLTQGGQGWGPHLLSLLAGSVPDGHSRAHHVRRLFPKQCPRHLYAWPRWSSRPEALALSPHADPGGIPPALQNLSRALRFLPLLALTAPAEVPVRPRQHLL